MPGRLNLLPPLPCVVALMQIELMPHNVITQLLRVLAIETKQEKAVINAEPTEAAHTGLEAFSFDYIVKWPLSLIINRFGSPRLVIVFFFKWIPIAFYALCG